MTNPVTVQSDFRLRNDDGSQTTATWVANQNTNANAFTDRNYRIRHNIRETNNRSFTLDARLEYNKGGAGWNAVNASSSNVRSSASANFADGDTTTEQLAGAGTFTAGRMEEADGQAAAISIQNQDTEVEHCFQIRSADVASGNTIQLRITDAGTLLTTYSQTITITVKFAYSLACDSGAFSVGGTAASPEVGREVAGAAGSYAVSGTAATLSKTIPLAAAAGSYSVSGTAATFDRTYRLAAAAVNHAVSGTAASLEVGRELAAAPGSYAVSGTAATFDRTYEIAGAGGSHAVSGTAASLEVGREVAAASGIYAVSGTAASLEYGREVAAAASSYAVSGTAANLIYGAGSTYTLAAVGGAFSVGGTAALLEYGRELAAAAGSYAVSGTAVALKKGSLLEASGTALVWAGSDAQLTYGVAAVPGIRPLNLLWLPAWAMRITHRATPFADEEDWGRGTAAASVAVSARAIEEREDWGSARHLAIAPAPCEALPFDADDDFGRSRGIRQPKVEDMLRALLARRAA